MNVIFVEEAQTEFLDAVSYYEEAQSGLGRRFKNEVEGKLRWIAEHPEVYRERGGLYRRVNLRAFPYFIPYMVQEQTLWVLAVAHGSRKPHYWIARRVSVG